MKRSEGMSVVCRLEQISHELDRSQYGRRGFSVKKSHPETSQAMNGYWEICSSIEG
jgi:hypothetical protein